MKRVSKKVSFGRKLTAVALSAAMAFSVAGCGGSSGSAKEENTYKVWLYSAQDASYYTDYAENPALKYLMDRTWGEEDKKISLEFLVPPAGSQLNNYETMMTSGDFPTLMQNSVADAAPGMYESGIILDLTDLVQQHMPNYYSLLQSNEELKARAVYNIDGEDKILALYVANDDYPYYFSGMMYRRDWIVKYGTNPQTGETFTGGYTDPTDLDSWVDDVVFPSGNTDPVYISDWEWMFEIFTKAQEALGITDSYCTSIYYPGYTWSGGLCSCFGEGIPVFYKASDGTAQFGGDKDSMRAYLQCLNNWYEKGWLDPDFNERTSDIFYAIDDTSIRTGKVGMWMGIQGELGGRLDLHDGGLTEGIYAAGCAWPVNDIYGTDACKNVEPRCISSATSMVGTGFYVMEGADEKDLPTLLSFLDYLYSEEGAAIHTLGLNAQQMAEDGVDKTFYEAQGLADGAYMMGEDGRYVEADALVNDAGNLLIAVSLEKLPGMQLVKNVDKGYKETYEHSLQNWIQYKNLGMINGSNVTNNMPSEEYKMLEDQQTKLLNYMELHAYEFIKGITDIDSDDDWNTWCTMLQKYNYQKVVDMLQPYIDAYPQL